jgi:glycine/D-amino acid oxidase-like deaminating enzyme
MPIKPIVVVGAGVVGLCVASYLQRAGKSVVILEASSPGSGASFGNGGLLSVDTHLPIAMPGMLRSVPKWLRDPLGPVTVRPRYALSAAPWLLKWIAAGRLDRVRSGARALRALHREGYERYQELLGSNRFNDLIRVSGVAQVWEYEGTTRTDDIATQLRDEAGIEYKFVTGAELRDVFPGMSSIVKQGIMLPRNGYTVSPERLVNAIAEEFVQTGGVIRRERVMKLVPQGSGIKLLTDRANQDAEAVVISAGAASRSLLDPLGVKLPLETERGYHLTLRNCSLSLSMPLMHRGRGFGFTPMEGGMRLSGTVEFAGLYSPPNERRAANLAQHARALFPSATWTEGNVWMGYRPSLPDSVPAIGPVPNVPGLFVATGHGHYGMVGAPATGKLASELITGATPHIDPAPYAMHRFG